MIDVQHNRILRGDNLNEPIIKWAVFFRTPLGLCEELPEAVKACLDKGIDPDMAVVPVCVAVGSTTYEEWLR